MPLYNPAASGVFNDLEVSTGIQLGNFPVFNDGQNIDLFSPEFYLKGDVFFDKINSGIGINHFNNNADHIFNKEPNYRSSQRFGLNYNYQFRFNENNLLSVGLSFNAQNENWNINWLPPTPNPDPSLPAKTGSTSAYNLGAGLLYKNRIWFAGFSINPILKLNEADRMLYNESNYALITGADIPLNDKYQLYSTLLVSSYLNDDYSANLMVQCMYNKIVFVGGGFAHGGNSADSWQAMIGARIAKNYRVHYAYGQTINDLIQSTAIHNIAFQFALGSLRSKE